MLNRVKRPIFELKKARVVTELIVLIIVVADQGHVVIVQQPADVARLPIHPFEDHILVHVHNKL